MKALDVQVGGGHYKSLAIQPAEYNQRNRLGFCEGSVVKYVTRHRSKNGVQDILKARHFIELLLDLEYPGWELENAAQRTIKSTTPQRKRRKIARRATRRVVKPKRKARSTRATAKKSTTSAR